jgi:signal transduction histidine kinase
VGEAAGERERLAGLLQEAIVLDHEMSLRTKPGRSIPMSLSLSRLLDQEGQSVGTVLIARDIRERKRQEEALRRSNQKLEDLTQEMEELLRVVSHDLQAPLVTIKGFSKLLDPLLREHRELVEQAVAATQANGLRAKAEALTARANEFLPFITTGVERMETLLGSLLSISRVGRKTKPFAPHDLNAILDEVLATLAHQLKEQRIEVVRHPLPRGVPCRRDELAQVFANLLNNAIKYMGEGATRRITITGRETETAVECDITDTGIGIAPKDQSRIFQLFTRLETVPIPGDGIGLAYVRKILRAHGGDVRLASQPGRGSTFTFWVPTQALRAQPADTANDESGV